MRYAAVLMRYLIHLHPVLLSSANDLGYGATRIGVRAEMARLYRLALNGRIRSDEMTRFVYALKEIRACLEAELLTDVQQRLVLLSRDMDNHNGQRIPYRPTFTGR
jgi:hypothetical protein